MIYETDGGLVIAILFHKSGYSQMRYVYRGKNYIHLLKEVTSLYRENLTIVQLPHCTNGLSVSLYE